MDTREKLIELLREVQYLGGLEEKIADHLISNGVTITVKGNMIMAKKKVDKLAQEAEMAMAAGMSYGKWKAMQEPIKNEQSPELDPELVV